LEELNGVEDKNQFKHTRPKGYPLAKGNDLQLEGIEVGAQALHFGQRRGVVGHGARPPGRPDHGHDTGGARYPGRDQAGAKQRLLTARTKKQGTPMNFHAKALLAFLAFHVIVTGGGLMFDQVPQALGQGSNDNDTQLVGAVLWALWCLTLSVGALGMAYLSRAAWKMGRGISRQIT